MTSEKKMNIKNRLIQYIYISLGVIILNIGFYFFLDPAKLVLGGMMGVSTILTPFFDKIGTWFTASIFLFIVNVICLIIGGILLGKDFFLKTIYASLFSPVVLFIFERIFPNPYVFIDSFTETGKVIMPLICGSVITGIGIGIAIKNNGSTGGMDVIQRIMSKYLKVRYSTTMYLTDWVVVVLSGLSFTAGFSYNLESVIFGMLGVYATSIIIDVIVLNAKSRRTAYIITEKPEEIKEMIYSTVGRGVTFVSATGGYTGDDKVMVICTMDKNQAYRLTDEIKKVDPLAFSFITSCKEVVGEYNRQRGILWL